jgi:DNA anti-recombination protein RmuC
MAYENTTKIGLKKAVIGTNQAFETQVFNDNLDAIDDEFIAVDARLDAAEGDIGSLGSQLSTAQSDISALETLTTSGSVHAADSATTATTASNALKIDSRKLNVGSTTPTSPTVGDLWIVV